MLAVFNTLGQEVTTLVEGEAEAGYYQVPFDASHLASGIDPNRFAAADNVLTRKLVLVR